MTIPEKIEEPDNRLTTDTFPAERPKAFVDSVVAIALTLLILPLMESVSEVARAGNDASSWFAEQHSQLLSFVLSFILIAMFWMIHHRLFSSVHRVTPTLLWILAAWMMSIVWLPVATAIAGRMSDDDLLARAVYIGSLVLTALVGLAVRLYLKKHPSLHSIDQPSFVDGLSVDISIALLFLVALILTTLVPTLGYYSLLIMLLSDMVQKLLTRMFGRRNG